MSTVTGVYHSILMEVEVDDEAETLLSSEIEEPTVPAVVATVKAKVEPGAIVDGLPFNTKIDQQYRDRYTISMMPNDQFAVVAAMDLPLGSMIMAEAPLFYTNADDNEGIWQLFERQLSLRYPNSEAFLRLKTSYEFTTRVLQRKNQHRFKRMIASKSFKLPKRLDFFDIIEQDSALNNRILVLYCTNRFKISDQAECVDSDKPLYGVYQDASRLNHSADPNCNADINEAPPFRLFLTTNRDVAKGEELTIRYHSEMHCGPVRHNEEAAQCIDLFGCGCFCSVCATKAEMAEITKPEMDEPKMDEAEPDEADMDDFELAKPEMVEHKVKRSKKFCAVM